MNVEKADPSIKYTTSLAYQLHCTTVTPGSGLFFHLIDVCHFLIFPH